MALAPTHMIAAAIFAMVVLVVAMRERRYGRPF
jgi:hypothetical protein